jgi:hypothetical protein
MSINTGVSMMYVGRANKDRQNWKNKHESACAHFGQAERAVNCYSGDCEERRALFVSQSN